MGPNYACLFVSYMEDAVLSQYTGFIPQLHKRYIDDVLGAACCDRKDLEDLIDYVSDSMLLSSTRTASLKLCYLSLISTCIYLAPVFKRSFTTKNQKHTQLFISSVLTPSSF